MEAVKKLEASKITTIILLAVLGTLLLTISAKIKIPFYPVPMTMQTFIVLLLGVLLGKKIGLITVSLYLFEGMFGLPVFAGTPEKGIGLIYFTGPTMGYLIGFLIAVYFSGSFEYNKGLINTFLKLLFSVSFIYILGLIWLGILIGWEKPIFKLGVQPFLLAEIFKVLLLTFLTSILLKFKKLIKIT
jgi:biotin transport system substrate-specific component|tara:strand:- start:104 stop:664 length:561 start_codon:yes stop_codon:yes gene_type:complete